MPSPWSDARRVDPAPATPIEQPAERPRVPLLVDSAVLALVTALASSLKAPALGLSVDDAAAGVYLGAHLFEGVGLYADAGFSQGPAVAWLFALLGTMGLATWTVAQSLALSAFTTGGGLVLLAARGLGRPARIVAATAALLAYEPLLVAARPLGATFAYACMAGLLAAASKERWALAGALGAVAVAFAPIAIIPVAAFAVARFLSDARTARRFAFALGAGLLVLFGVALLAHGPGAILRPLAASVGSRARVFGVVFGSFGWLLLAALAPLVARSYVPLSSVLVFVGLAAVVSDRSLLVVAWPAVALGCATSTRGLVERFATRRVVALLVVPVVVAAVVGGRFGRGPGDPVPGRRYEKPVAPAAIVAFSLFWVDRTPPDVQPSLFTRVLWADSLRRARLEPLVSALKSRVGRDETFLADAPHAASLALAAERRVAADAVDASLARLDGAGLSELHERVTAARPRVVVASSGEGLPGASPFSAWVLDAFSVAETLPTAAGANATVYAARH